LPAVGWKEERKDFMILTLTSFYLWIKHMILKVIQRLLEVKERENLDIRLTACDTGSHLLAVNPRTRLQIPSPFLCCSTQGKGKEKESSSLPGISFSFPLPAGKE
jgi:hypothetical protein